MKKTIFIFFLLIFILVDSFSQSIRKNFKELTTSEKSELQNALYALRDLDGDGEADATPNDDDLIYDLANFHSIYFDIDRTDDSNLDIHFNLPTQLNINIFVAWHRYQMYEYEHALQNVNPKLSIPYWNSSIDTITATVQNTLFAPDLLGPFDADWGLNRNLQTNASLLPTPTGLSAIESITDFANGITNDGGYTNQIERGLPHSGAHRWVRGFMQSTGSPGDPVFYFHHSWIDKLWDDWETANPGASWFAVSSMIRYDGTYSFNGNTLPSINPNDLVNSNDLGIFYAENQLAEMDNYSVTNNFNATETFYYQYTIEAGDNFIVPNSKVCEIESVNMVVLKPGFTAENGATFLAKIDTDNDINTAARNAVAQNRYNPIIIDNVRYGVYEPEYMEKGPKQEPVEIKTQMFPNPFKNRLTLTFNEEVENFKVEIYDVTGKQVFSKSYSKTAKVLLNDLEFLSVGNYILKVFSDESIILQSKILKI